MAESPQSPSDPKDQMKYGLAYFFEGMGKFFSSLIDLKDGLDKEGTIINIKSNKRMRGANAWMLMCSIMIASLGLDLNSPAVIIGAMLISPLMSPILGVGLGVGINDKNTLFVSLQHFGIAIAIALITSTIYFLFTPFGEITKEISARTQPTLLDAFIAFFGGVAGIISGSRKDKTNAIPGVAIATALMPPLCVTGFGLANLMKYGVVKQSINSLTTLNNWEILLNSFYLFFLNSVLVALATFLIVRFLRFPIKKYVDPKEGRRTNMIVFGVSILLLIPSITLLRRVLEDVRESNTIKYALEDVFQTEMKYIDGWKIIKTDSTKELLVKVYTPSLQDSLGFYLKKLNPKLPKIDVELISTSEINLDKFRSIEAQVNSIASQLNEDVKAIEKDQELLVKNLKDKIALLQSDSLLEASVEGEVLAMFKDYIDRVTFSMPRAAMQPAVINLHFANSRNSPKALIEESLKGYLRQRCHKDSVVIGYLAD